MALEDPIDALLDADGDLVIDSDLRLASGLDAVSQGIRVRILTFHGEWFLNLEIGVRWFEDILGKAFDQSTAMSAIREQILNTPNVRAIKSLSARFLSTTRTLTVEWSVSTVFGTANGSLSQELL